MADSSLIVSENVSLLNQITVRQDSAAPRFYTLAPAEVEKIATDMLECNRAVRAFGRQNSQTTAKLMTLTMMEAGPYRVLRQCLAQIESRRTALRENIFKIKREEVRIRQLERVIARNEDGKDLAEIDLEEARANLSDSFLYIEGALKEIAIYQDSYEEIRKSNNIPEKWDENDFEDAEVDHHIRQAFRLALRDVMERQSLTQGTMEYLEQLGIHPLAARKAVIEYLAEAEKKASETGGYSSISSWYSFLDNMVLMFKGQHLEAMKRIGLSRLVNPDLAYTEPKSG